MVLSHAKVVALLECYGWLLKCYYAIFKAFRVGFLCYVVACEFWVVARPVLGFYCCKGGHHNSRVVARASLCSF